MNENKNDWKNEVMRIGLYGIGGVYNFGCEAIVRGTYQLIKKINPYSEIIYFSHNYEYDSKMLADLDIKICKIKRSQNFLKRCINKGLYIIGSNIRVAMLDHNAIMARADVFFSIGGDIYTIPAVLRENKNYPYYNSLIDFCNKAVNRGKKIIVYGASIGPFGGYQSAIDYYVRNLKRYEYIICRELSTIEYLKKLGIEKTFFLPDPAFQVRSSLQEEIGEKKYIGINLSPLSLYEVYGDCSTKNIKKLAGLIDRIYDRFHIDIMFIPHVLSSLENDNDFLFQKKIVEVMREENQQHILFADYNQGFLGIKEQLHQCYFVVSARMHCAINSIVENVPALFLSYSQKSIGMCEYVYGSDRWVVQLEDIEIELINKMKQMMNEKDDISRYLEKRNREIQEYYENHISEIKLG